MFGYKLVKKKTLQKTSNKIIDLMLEIDNLNDLIKCQKNDIDKLEQEKYYKGFSREKREAIDVKPIEIDPRHDYDLITDHDAEQYNKEFMKQFRGNNFK